MPTEQNDTIIGANVELTGSLRNRGPIHIHGIVKGDIRSESTVIIGETAIVTGPIFAKQVEVSGQVHGSIQAEELIELTPKSVVKGDLTCSLLSIKPGAIFVGKANMATPTEMTSEDEPLPEEKLDPSLKKKPRLEIE